MAKRGRPAGTDSEQTKRKILDAARLDFAANGYDGASITSIAANVGIAPSAIYHYFQSKEKLYTEVFKQTSSTIWDSVTPIRRSKNFTRSYDGPFG